MLKGSPSIDAIKVQLVLTQLVLTRVVLASLVSHVVEEQQGASLRNYC